MPEANEIVSSNASVGSYVSHNAVVIETVESYPDGKISTEYRLPAGDAFRFGVEVILDSIRATLSKIVIK